MDYIDGFGYLCNDRIVRAMLTHRNLPKKNIGMPPAVMLYDRKITDHLSVLHEKCQIHKSHLEIKELRETMMVKRPQLNQKQFKTLSHPLWEFQVGELVQVQSQNGSYPRWWIKTGRVVETLGNKQHLVLIDSSNRITQYNRSFLRKIISIMNTSDYSTPQPRLQKLISISNDISVSFKSPFFYQYLKRTP